MAFFKSLIKEHGKTFFEPVGRALQAAGHPQAESAQPGPCLGAQGRAVAILRNGGPARCWRPGSGSISMGRRFHPDLLAHAEFAVAGLEGSRLEISNLMFKHQLRLADRQCRMAELSQRIQDRVVMLATSLWAGRQSSEIVQAAADVLCSDLKRRLTGRRPSDGDYRAVTKLGEAVASGGFEAIAGIEAGEILMPYAS